MARIIKNEENTVNTNSEVVIERLKAFDRGDLTWAELEGMTWEQAKAIADVACDLANVGRLEESRILFEGLVAGNPKDAAGHAALGTVYQKLGRQQDAIGAYTAAIGLDPKNAVALANRGELRLKKGEREGFADIAAAVEADPAGTTAAGRRAKGMVKAITLMAVEQGRRTH